MNTTKKDLFALDAQVRLTKGGYAAGIRCPRSHDGNRGLANSTVGTWQCQGCTQSYHVGEVLRMQAGEASPGRPPTDRGRGSPQVSVRLSPDEHARVEADAAKRGVSPAEILRRSYFGR